MRKIIKYCATPLLLLLLAFSGKGFGKTLRKSSLRKDNIVASNDSNFVDLYSKILGIGLDSCCNRKLIATVSGWLKVPYRAGGNTKRGTDCSGFVSAIYKDVFGVTLSHGGLSMFRQMRQLVRKNEKLQEGDILFFRERGTRITHVGLYLKDGKFIHSATYGVGVVINDLRSAYYRRTYYMAGRVFPVVM